jgi:tetratricopeptide (TPR) repeat protein
MKLISRVSLVAILPPLVAAAVLVAAPAGGGGQDAPPSIKQLFESGKYQDIVGREAQAGPSGDPLDDYYVAQAYLRLQDGDGARRVLDRLAQRGEADPWAIVARAERARVDRNFDEALALAQAAVALPPPPEVAAYAYYGLGLVQSQRQDMPAAAEAFEQATAADPSLAYAHYYAGLAYSRLRRIDREAAHFEAFLALAPEAPERGAVESIMQTIRGK